MAGPLGRRHGTSLRGLGCVTGTLGGTRYSIFPWKAPSVILLGTQFFGIHDIATAQTGCYQNRAVPAGQIKSNG